MSDNEHIEIEIIQGIEKLKDDGFITDISTNRLTDDSIIGLNVEHEGKGLQVVFNAKGCIVSPYHSKDRGKEISWNSEDIVEKVLDRVKQLVLKKP